jgi:hypothetical protein
MLSSRSQGPTEMRDRNLVYVGVGSKSEVQRAVLSVMRRRTDIEARAGLNVGSPAVTRRSSGGQRTSEKCHELPFSFCKTYPMSWRRGGPASQTISAAK